MHILLYTLVYHYVCASTETLRTKGLVQCRIVNLVMILNYECVGLCYKLVDHSRNTTLKCHVKTASYMEIHGVLFYNSSLKVSLL